MKLPSSTHWSRALVVLFLFAFATVLAVNKEDAKLFIKAAFASDVIPICIWVYASVAVVSKNLFIGNGQTTQFGAYADTIFSIGTYGLAGTTSTTLLQGVYLQYFYEDAYFRSFGALDLASVALVSSYLLIYVGLETTRMFADVLFRAKGASAEPSGAP